MRRRNNAHSAFAIVALAALLQIACLRAAEPRKPYNAEAAKLRNPVASNAETIDKGKALYRRHCASCHGVGGKGDGGQALSGGEPSDLTDDVWDFGSTDGEIFVVIRDGLSADMLAYKDKLKDEQMWQVVVYLRSLGPKQPK
jgi:cbb3-type cytochrome c oxidase subunit III